MNVRDGLANRDDEARIREQSREVPDPRDVVVALRQVTLPAAQRQDLAQVSAEGVLEVRPVDCFVEQMNAAGIVQPSEVTLPKRLFECLRTLRGDSDAVGVDAFLRIARARLGEAILEPVPQERYVEKRKVAITVRRYAIGLRQQCQQNRSTGARQTGQEHGPVDLYAIQAARDEIGLEIGENFVQWAETLTQRDEAEVLIAQDHARHRRSIAATAPSVAIPKNSHFQLAWCS